jgi:hypothetical protein
MNIELIEDAAVSPTELLEQLGLLDDDAKGTLHQMSLIIIATLLSKTGTVILMSDIKGDGVANIIAAGNPALVPPLMYTASEAADAMFKRPEGSTQQ